MPIYRLQFRVESCLTSRTDITLENEGASVLFLFSKRTPEDRYVRAVTQIEATNNGEAQVIASSSVIPPLLDAISFATGTSLFLNSCELVLKHETGNQKRRAIHVGLKATPKLVAFDDYAVEDAAKLIERKDIQLTLCWLRYALHRELSPDQFLFNWLAFEALAGDADIPNRCPRCREQLHHCDIAITHRGSSEDRAAEIFCDANPSMSIKEFKKEIWREARNRIFHGRKYPKPEFLAHLASVSNQIRAAAEEAISPNKAASKHYPANKPHYGYEYTYLVHSFVEWTTSQPDKQFADDWPLNELNKRVAVAEPDTVIAGDTSNVDFLNWKETADW